MATRNAVFVYGPELERIQYPVDCPFRNERSGKVRGVLNSMGLLGGPGVRELVPQPAERRILRKFHSAAYVHALRRAQAGQLSPQALRMGIGSPDCPVFNGMYDLAVLATGGTIAAARLVLDGDADVVFNTAGGFHHAGPERAAGFCYLNDVALACKVLAEAGKKVLYLDVDVHFGDGVAYAFYGRSDVMTISLHQNPKTLFPGTGFEDEIGEGEGAGYCVNLPLPVGTYDQAYVQAFESVAAPLMEAYRPDVIVLQLGADALAGDPLAHLRLTNNTYVHVVNRVLGLDRPILMTGGGGYNVENTVRAWALAWTVLSGQDVSDGLGAAVGGVMLESTDWQGGLRDRELAVSNQQRQSVLPALEASIDMIRVKVFPIHGL